MRTTVRLDSELIARAKDIAAETGGTVTAVIEDALRESLERRAATPKKRVVRIPTFPGGSVRPGVDLNSNAALLELMEEERYDEIRKHFDADVLRKPD